MTLPFTPFVGRGKVVQHVSTQTGASAVGSTVMPHDDTIPQNTEGDQYMTLAITPKGASNILEIEVVFHASSTAGGTMKAALFQDSTAGALAVGATAIPGANIPLPVVFRHRMTAGTTSATTFKVRAGNQNGSTTTFNGASSARLYGGVFASSITITEMTP